MQTINYQLHTSKINSTSTHKVLVVILDGVGYIEPANNISLKLDEQSSVLPAEAFYNGNAVSAAYTPNLSKLFKGNLFRTILAHGPSVGLPSEDDMGNSEVGHNAIGAGRIFAQGAKLVNSAIENGSIFSGNTWNYLTENPALHTGKNKLHLLGLFSDGNVHSHIEHMFSLIKGAKKSGVKQVMLHLLLDGRDVPPTSALEYVTQLEKFLEETNSSDFNCTVASGGGRMFVTMDRYESDWTIVERGYAAHVCGEARFFGSIRDAIDTYRKELNVTDQNMPPFVIAKDNKPVGEIIDGDSVVLFNFRGDRAIQISKALTEKNFSAFKRKKFPSIRYAGMMQYDGDLKLPEMFLVTPPAIDNTMGELLAHVKVKQFACSETQKFGHTTYFWNGNRSGKFSEELENYVEIPSDKVPFNERPWMKCAEIADETIKQMHANSFRVGRINFANGDMVGHTGDFPATVASMSAVDLQLGRLMQAAKDTNTILIVTADHGNADEMFELNKKTGKVNLDKTGKPKVKTSHTLSPVPLAVFNSEILNLDIALQPGLPNAGLANIASTVLELAGFQAPDFYEKSLIIMSAEKKN